MFLSATLSKKEVFSGVLCGIALLESEQHPFCLESQKALFMSEKKERNIRLQIILIILFVVLAGLLFLVLDNRKNCHRQEYLQLITERYEHAYNTIYDQYKELASALYSGIVGRYDIPLLYQHLLSADEEEKNRLRQELWSSIQPRYEKLQQESHVKHLIHFHLQDNESFLRLHQPDKYGDNLTVIRQTVATVNRDRLPVDGFEEGKMYSGYRFVFPITAADQTHLGSMEISFGPEALTATMMKQYVVLSNFFIKESALKRGLFPGELEKNYKKSHHHGYFYDKNVLAALNKVSRKGMKELKPKRKTTDKIYTNVHSGRARSTYEASSNLVFTTIPVLNPITQEMVAFFTVRSQSAFFAIQQQQFGNVFFLSLLLLFTVLSIFYLQQSRKKAIEANVRELEEQRKQLVGAQTIAKLGHWELDLLTNHLHWSDQIYHIFGLRPGEIIASFEAFLEKVHPDDRDFVTTSYFDSVHKHHHYDIQHRIIMEGGAEKWVREICSTEYDNNGTPLRSLGIVHDITEQHHAMTLLQREHERFMQGPVMTFTWQNNEQWAVEQVSENVIDILEYSAKEFLDGTVRYGSIIHPDDLQRVTDEVAANSGPESSSFTHEPYRLTSRHGEIVWVLDSTSVVRDSQGNISLYQGYLVNISHTMLMKEEILETKNRLELIISGAKLGTWEWNVKSGEVIFNDRWAEIIGYDLDEIEPNVSTWEQIVHPDEQETVKQMLNEHLEGRSPVYMTEHRLRHKSGKWIWVLDVGKVFERDKNDQPLRAVGIHIDVTEQKEAELLLIAAKEDAESANRTKSTFLANMSHELRTPLNAILGYTQIFAGDSSLTAEQQSGIKTIHQAGEHLLLLLNDILDLSKIEAGKTELEPTVFSLPLFLQGIVDIIRIRTGQRNLKFLYVPEEPLPVRIEADELRLRQVLLNLLSNAAKFTAKGYCLLKVHSRRVDEDRALLIFIVEDSGAGIAPEKQEEVFQPFEQAGERLLYSKGFGLGLAISRKLVRLMGGELRLVSPIHEQPKAGEGVGSRFFFSIEVLVLSNTESVLKEHRIVTGYTCARGTLKRVLLVDENSLNRAVLRATLKPLGFIVNEGGDGDEVLAACKQFMPDIILMDLRMPGLDGATAAKQLKQHPDYAHIPVIAISASPVASELDGTEIQDNTFVGYVNKPFVTIDLLELIAAQLSISLNYVEEQALGTRIDECVCPPAEDIEELLILVRNGDIAGLTKKTEALAVEGSSIYREFSTRLGQLVDDFQVTRITQFIETCQTQKLYENGAIKEEVSNSPGSNETIPDILFRR